MRWRSYGMQAAVAPNRQAPFEKIIGILSNRLESRSRD